jgi:hypothetical protein
MEKKKVHAKGEEKHQGILDKLIHGDHGHASESEEAEVENDLPVESKPSKSKKNSDEGASSESKHHHKKFDKFKKGNS